MPLNSNLVRYEKREPKPATEANPTVQSLMNARDRTNWVDVTIPKKTAAFDVRFDPISLNRRTFQPGETYKVPPPIAEELRIAIANFEEAVLLQVQKRNKANIPQYTGEFTDAETLQSMG